MHSASTDGNGSKFHCKCTYANVFMERAKCICFIVTKSCNQFCNYCEQRKLFCNCFAKWLHRLCSNFCNGESDSCRTNCRKQFSGLFRNNFKFDGKFYRNKLFVEWSEQFYFLFTKSNSRKYYNCCRRNLFRNCNG